MSNTRAVVFLPSLTAQSRVPSPQLQINPTLKLKLNYKPNDREKNMHSISCTSVGRWVKGLGICLFLILAIAPRGSSQTQMTTGTIQGTVTDANGGIVPGANVEIKNLETNFSKTLTTDD